MKRFATTATVLLALALVLAGSGCSLPSQAAPGEGRNTTVELEARLVAGTPDPAAGTGTDFTLEVTNRGPAKVSLEFNTSQEFDVVIKSGAATVWRWSGGMMFLQVITRKELAPGESLSYHVRWDGNGNDGKPLPAGTYTVTAEFKARGVKVGVPQLRLVIR